MLKTLGIGALMALFSTGFALAEPSWGSGSVTYSASVTDIDIGDSSSVSLSMFNSEDVASHLGGQASEYTLTSIILTLDSSIAGDFYYLNKSTTTTRSPVLQIFGGAVASVGGASTPLESYEQQISVGSVAPLNSATLPLDLSGQGAQSTDITSGLDAYLGSGNVLVTVDFSQISSLILLGGSYNSSLDWLGAANVSVTYEFDYTPVPEPSALSLITVALAYIATSRKNRCERS